ncbi:hypothetical protein RugamoR1_44290 [Rugamonas sp. R1(2021)]
MLGVHARARLALRRRKLDLPLAKFVLLPLALAIPAFHLHQHIAYGEYYSFGLKAYLVAFALRWAAWSIGGVLSAAIEAVWRLGRTELFFPRPIRFAPLRRHTHNRPDWRACPTGDEL